MSKKKLTAAEVIYCRDNYVSGDKEFGIRGLAKKLGVKADVIKDLIHGETYKDVGGKIHAPRERLTTEAKIAIASGADFQTLAMKFGISEETIQKYLDSQQPKKSAAISDEVKAAIRAEYVPYSKEFGREALAAKYGVSPATIGQIVKGTPRKVKPEIPDFIKEAIIEAVDAEKMTVKALAERFSLSREAVKSVLLEAGITLRKRVDDDTKKEIVEAYKAGQSLRELEEIYGVNRATIADWIRPFKREKPKVELTQELREQIYRYHSQGYGIGIIGKTLGISQKTVRRIIDGEL
ncbi:MAG: helix-turn-helix domain-containing protein [Selenomonadaceae bacterium]|nr:helix-turn-helix domain-containing protein [Selenomonadaceae bacterium]